MLAAFILVALKGCQSQREAQTIGNWWLQDTREHGWVSKPLCHLLEVDDDAAFFHHGVLLVVFHQIGQSVESFTPSHVILPFLQRANINN